MRQHGSLNPHPEAVRHELFRTHEFFDPADLVQVKYEMLRQVLVERSSVTEAAAEFGLSRPSFYEAKAAFEESGLLGLVPERRGPRRAHKLSAEIMEFLRAAKAEDPTLSGAALARQVMERATVACSSAKHRASPGAQSKKTADGDAGTELDRHAVRGTYHVLRGATDSSAGLRLVAVLV